MRGAWSGLRVAVLVFALSGDDSAVRAATPESSAQPEPAATWKPAEPADAVLHAENSIWSRHLHDALRLPNWLDVAAESRTRFELLDDPWRPGESQRQAYFPLRHRLRVGVDGPEGLRFLVELQDAHLFSARPDDFTATQLDPVDVLQLFVSGTRRDLFGRGLRADLHLGRLTLDLGSRRLVARNDFRNTVNAGDGVHLQLGSDDRKWRVRGFYTLPVLVREGDFMNDRFSTRRRFWGLAFEDLRSPWLFLDVYALGLDDLPGNRSFRTYGLRAYRKPAPAQLDYEAELAAQFGDRRSAATGVRDQEAYMLHAEIGYTLGVPWSPRAALQLDYATGNDDPSDDDAHAFDPLFGARRFDLAPTGAFGAFRRTNLLSPGVRFSLQPAKTVRLDLKVRHWMLDEARDAFAGTAGPDGPALVDPTGDAGRDLGTDLELRARWDAREWLSFDTAYVHWWKGSYLDDVTGAETRGDADYFYLQSRLRF